MASEDREAYYLVRLGPYCDGDQRTEGVVVTIVDVCSLTHTEAHKQHILIAELQHRTRNLLGIVQSIAQQTLGRGRSLEAFRCGSQRLGGCKVSSVTA